MTKAVLYSRYGAFAMALVATLGSLFLSEILKLPPCVLCWYQRVLMYPLAFIIGIGILRGDKKLYQYVLPLASIGWLIALYHSLLQWKIIPESAAPCVQGISCIILAAFALRIKSKFMLHPTVFVLALPMRQQRLYCALRQKYV